MALRACQFPGLLIRVPSMQLQGFVAVTAAMPQAPVRQVSGWLRNGTLPHSLQSTCRLQQLAGGNRIAENGSCPVVGRPALFWATTLWGGFIRNALPETRLRLNIWHDERYIPLFRLLTRGGWRGRSHSTQRYRSSSALSLELLVSALWHGRTASSPRQKAGA